MIEALARKDSTLPGSSWKPVLLGQYKGNEKLWGAAERVRSTRTGCSRDQAESVKPPLLSQQVCSMWKGKKAKERKRERREEEREKRKREGEV